MQLGLHDWFCRLEFGESNTLEENYESLKSKIRHLEMELEHLRSEYIVSTQQKL